MTFFCGFCVDDSIASATNTRKVVDVVDDHNATAAFKSDVNNVQSTSRGGKMEWMGGRCLCVLCVIYICPRIILSPIDETLPWFFVTHTHREFKIYLLEVCSITDHARTGVKLCLCLEYG